MTIVIAALAILAALLAPRLVDADAAAFGAHMDRVEHWLRKYGPLAAAIVSALVIWWTWGQRLPLPIIHDESSYLLQADIFARGRWTVPTPPIPEFFEQPHVLVVPAVASKYPPGHALLLSIGALVGFRTLVPLLLTGVTAALIFALAARVSNAWVALLTWVFWISAPLVLRFQPSYFSELTTTTMLLASWWMLLEWRETRKLRWLLLMALAIGWGAITRPLTMLALAMPIGVVVVRDVIRLHRGRDLGLACAVGAVILAILPLWSARTTGDWKLWPVELYRRDYMPYDKMGFTADSTPPRRAASLSAVLVGHNIGFYALAKQHQLKALPEILGLRVVKLAAELFPVGRLPLLLFAVVGLVASAALQFAALSTLLLFAAYLPYPHWSGWPVYYLEIVPAVAALTAVGVWRVAQRVARSERRANLSVALVTMLLAWLAPSTIKGWRRGHLGWTSTYRAFANQAQHLPGQPAILFVRYSPRTLDHMAVVYNFADLAKAPVWVVHDLGERNAELLRRAPGRTAQYFDEDKVLGGGP